MQEQPEDFLAESTVVCSVIPTALQVCKCRLAIEVLQRFGEIRLRVTGSSMLPALWPGDVLTIERVEVSEVCPQDLVLFARDNRLFVHRLLALSSTGVLTGGDALSAPDPPVSGEELLGRVISITRGQTVHPPMPLDWKGRLLAAVARRSTTFCNFLLRLRTAYQRLLQTPSAALAEPGEVWPM